jgi:hypothetical protein
VSVKLVESERSWLKRECEGRLKCPEGDIPFTIILQRQIAIDRALHQNNVIKSIAAKIISNGLELITQG